MSRDSDSTEKSESVGSLLLQMMNLLMIRMLHVALVDGISSGSVDSCLWPH